MRRKARLDEALDLGGERRRGLVSSFRHNERFDDLGAHGIRLADHRRKGDGWMPAGPYTSVTGRPRTASPRARVSAPSAPPPEPTERRRMSPGARAAERIMRSAVGGMKALRTPILAISAKACSGSNFSAWCA